MSAYVDGSSALFRGRARLGRRKRIARAAGTRNGTMRGKQYLAPCGEAASAATRGWRPYVHTVRDTPAKAKSDLVVTCFRLGAHLSRHSDSDVS
jgi:hypothetical protein